MHTYSPSGKTTISNDGATIMKLLDIVHPAAKTLVDISLSQDAEVGVGGDGGKVCMGGDDGGKVGMGGGKVGVDGKMGG